MAVAVADLGPLAERPIEVWARDSASDRAIAKFLKAHDRTAEIPEAPWCEPRNEYLRLGLKGAGQTMLAREALWLKLGSVAPRLPAGVKFVVFDSFRSRETQRDLFSRMKAEIRSRSPNMEDAALTAETRKYCSDPDRLPPVVQPHNSGGAIDLALGEIGGGDLDFGGAFDDPAEISHTAFFEAPFDPAFGVPESRWRGARALRRVLFHLMTEAGFSNYFREWWHYDLGNRLWAEKTGLPPVFDSMEDALGRAVPGAGAP
jgi:D-alanyl-D-alanine dipeptidase